MKAAFKEYFQSLLGPEESEQFFCSIQKKETHRALRCNTLKTSPAELIQWLQSQGFEVIESPYAAEGLRISGRGRELSLKLPYYSGFTYPQDESSMFSVALLDPKPHEIVVDLTAAPGGKSTMIAARMQNTGVLLSNDMDTRRHKALRSNFERLGILNAVLSHMTVAKLSHLYPETFDRVLLDPSCSGEGLLVTHDGKPNFWSLKALKIHAKTQFQLLKQAFQLLKPGGRLVYSTCTLNTIENDGVVDHFLKQFPQAKTVTPESLGLTPPPQLGDLWGTRFWPHLTGTKGFFCIAFTKTESLYPAPPHEGNFTQLQRVPKKILQALEEQMIRAYNYFPSSLRAVYRGSEIALVSEELAEFAILREALLPYPFYLEKQHSWDLSRGAALFIGLHAKQGVYSLNRPEVEGLFSGTLRDLNAPQKDLLISYEGFPLGKAELPLKPWA